MSNPCRWQQTELAFKNELEFENPYLQFEIWAEFIHQDGTKLVRPGFWDGGKAWKLRFAGPKSGLWCWHLRTNHEASILNGMVGEITVSEEAGEHRFLQKGFWEFLPGHRNMQHRDGTPAILVADTPWAMPWRATPTQAEKFAEDRQKKGFNAALLMSIQPDRGAKGPRTRTEIDGFDVGFEDLPLAKLEQIRPEYFQTLDEISEVLFRHEIVPIWQPVFHGYGWKGLDAAGNHISGVDYARYCRYLVARYGARPAIWLVGADDDGKAKGVEPGGLEIEKWDAYKQPKGLHYAPHQVPNAFQDRDWLDFQWCQTGHSGEHSPHRVATMWEIQPIKAVANGETTYENIGEMGRASGWWQGHEAWMNLCSGGTMGVVYGAGSLWQWRLSRDEIHAEWCLAKDADWQTALDFEGSNYVGVVSKIFEGLLFAEMQPDHVHTGGRPGLYVRDNLLVVYLFAGGTCNLSATDGVPEPWKVVDPRSGEVMSSGMGHAGVQTPKNRPCLVIFSSTFA